MGEAATIPGVIQRSTSAGNVEGKTPGLQTRPTAPLTNKKNQPSWIASAAGATLALNYINANSANSPESPHSPESSCSPESTDSPELPDSEVNTRITENHIHQNHQNNQTHFSQFFPNTNFNAEFAQFTEV